MVNVTDHKFRNIVSANSTDEFLFSEYTASLMLWKVCPPFILVLGGFGNIATIFVMYRTKGHDSTQHIILTALAVSDLFLLYAGLLRQWVYFLFGVNLRNLHSVVCKVQIWVLYSCNIMSAWLVTSVTIQRTMAVTYPHKMRMMCSSQRTWSMVAAVILTAFSLQFHFVIGMDVSSKNVCTPISDWYANNLIIWHWADMCFSSFLPSVCLLVCNVILSLTLFTITSASKSLTVHAISNFNVTHSNNSRRKTASRTTVMILALSCTFLTLTLPVCAVIIWRSIDQTTRGTSLFALQQLASSVTNLLWYTNSAVNFFLYCFTGTKFRTEFLKWIRCGFRNHSNM